MPRLISRHLTAQRGALTTLGGALTTLRGVLTTLEGVLTMARGAAQSLLIACYMATPGVGKRGGENLFPYPVRHGSVTTNSTSDGKDKRLGL